MNVQGMRALTVVIACAVSEHRSRAPVESCGVVCCTPQALSLFLESCGSCVTIHKLCHCFLSHGTLCCVSHCVCVLSSLSIVLLCIYTAVDWELSPQSHSLHCSPLGALSLKGPLSRVFNREEAHQQWRELRVREVSCRQCLGPYQSSLV